MKKELYVHKRLLFIMRVSVMQLIIPLAFISIADARTANAQVLEKRISVEFNNIGLRPALAKIERIAEVKFLYQSRLISPGQRIKLSFIDETLEEILNRILEPQRINYKAEGNQIVLTKLNATLKSDSEMESEFPFVDLSISGVVTDDVDSPLPGVNVLIKGTTIGTSTDANGRYTLSVPDEKSILVFSFIGFLEQEVTVGTQTQIDIKMLPDIHLLSEVVVVGYGEVKKSDLTGSVSQVKTKELEAVPVYNVEQALKGRAAGVRVTQNSGAPGGRIEVRIRGGNSMIGSNDPLYVVDGFPLTGGIDFLNPSDIESIDILKDASATAIYGSRGANGVVIITTKKGKSAGNGTIDISTYFGSQQAINTYELLNAKEYATVANEWLKNNGQPEFFDVNAVNNPGTNWQDLILRNAPIQNHTITVSGSSEKTRYSLSGNYFGQEGIIINSGVKKGTFRLNLDHDVKRWLNFATNLNFSRRDLLSVPVDNGNYGGSSILSAAVSAAPTLGPYDNNGVPTQVGQEYIWGEATMQNPLIYKDPYKNRAFANSLIGNVSFLARLTDNLSFKSLFGVEYDETTSESFAPIIYPNDRGFAYEGNSYRNSLLNENVITYQNTFNVHAISAIAGFTYQSNFSRYSNISVAGFANNTTENFDLSSAETVNPPSSGNSDWRLLSWLARVNYTLNDKYLLTGSVRADGSSRFGADNKWGVFPSGAIAWKISKERFMENIAVVSDFKLRASYGVTGNTALSPYQSLNRLTSVTAVLGNQTNVIGYVPVSLANPDLKWETTTQADVGIDLNLFKDKLRITADYYKKNTTDLLASVPLPPSSGFGSILRNIGEIENKGFEFMATTDIIDRELKWTLSANISTNKNKIVKLSEGKDIFGDQLNLFRSSLNIARVGEPFGALYGLQEDGLDNNGFIKYVDVNNDGSINQLDRVIIGNPYPDFIYGINTDIAFKGFDLNIFFEGVHGNDIFWATAGTHLNSFQRGNNQFADLIGNYWTQENPNPNAKYPKISSATLIDVSDRFIMDGSYLRLKALRLSYKIPAAKLGWSSIKELQLYVSTNNLLTITKYPGPDPEANTTGTDDQNVGSRLRVGIDQSAYPSARIFAGGLKLSF